MKKYNIFEAMPAHTRKANWVKYNAALLIDSRIETYVLKQEVNYISVILSNLELVGA